VFDYFDVRKARTVNPKSKESAADKFPYQVKRNAPHQRAIVREKSGRYRKK
jgi:hypothetical protein